jgi:hypothetical protein
MNKAYVDGHIESTVDFDYDAVDEHLSGAKPESYPPYSTVPRW